MRCVLTQSRSPTQLQLRKFEEVKKAVLMGQGGFLFRQPGSSWLDWIVVVQLPLGSFQEEVQPIGPPEVWSVWSFPIGFPQLSPRLGSLTFFCHTVSSGSLRSAGMASHQLSPPSPGYVATGTPSTIVTEPVKIPPLS